VHFKKTQVGVMGVMGVMSVPFPLDAVVNEVYSCTHDNDSISRIVSVVIANLIRIVGDISNFNKFPDATMLLD
jgi:hypothetical protein